MNHNTKTTLFPAKTQLNLALAADLHFYPQALAGGYNQAFKDDNYDLGKPAEQSERLLRSALAGLKEQAKREGLHYLLLAGDLTRNGEYEAHAGLAALLLKFQQESGVRVLLVPGNHDLNNPDAAEYSGGTKAPARQTSPEEFLELYRHFRPQGIRPCPQNALSYAFELNEDYCLVVLDTCKYDSDGHVQVSGAIDDATLQWALNECARAKRAGKIVLGMMHHNLAEHVGYQAALFHGYLLDDYIPVREALAEAGMRFCFTGHTHRGHAAEVLSDNGALLYDICAPALYAFPCELQLLSFSRTGKKVAAQVKAISADTAVSPKESYQFTFCGSQGGGLTGFFQANARIRLTPLLEEMAQAGGVKAWLSERGTTVDSALLNALFAQLDTRYISDPAHAVQFVCRMLEDAMNQPLSRLPARQFLHNLGIGHKTRPGTLRDFMETNVALVYWQGDTKNDPFLQDVFRSIKDGSFVDNTLRFLIDKIVDDLLAKELLPQLKLRLGAKTERKAKAALQTALGLFINLRRRRTISRTLEWLFMSFLGQPRVQEFTLVHKGRVRVKALQDEFRRPMDLQVSLNDDQTCATVTWYTKASVTGSDVFVHDDQMRPVRGLKIITSTTQQPYTARKLNIGVARIFGHEIDATKHTAIVPDLKPGRYAIRVGDKSRGWLSQWVTLNTMPPGKTARVLGHCKSGLSTAAKVLFSFRLVR